MQENREMASQGPALPPPPAMARRNSSTFGQSARSSMSSDRPFDAAHPPSFPPPRPNSEASNDSERRGSRTQASVHAMLNPSGADDEQRRSRRRSAAQMEEESPLISPVMANMPSGRPSSSGGRSGAASPPPGLGGKPINPRRILTPISPTLHRTTSLSRIVTGTIDAASTPFLSPDTTMSSSEPNHAAIPPLHTFPGPLMPQRQSFSYSQAPTPPPPSVTRRKSVSILPSARASPSPSSYSSYTQSGQASPSLNPQSTAPTPPGSFSLAPSPVVGPLKVGAPVIMDPEFSHHIPLPPGSQTAYELMTISTSKGSAQIPVEVHVASRQADEKRKRNAGASARFRQRRKEKEREANSTIERLRQDLQYMTEDCEYYKSERNRLLEILKDTPGFEHLQPRSPSPPSTRRRAESAQATSSGGGTSGAVSPRSPPLSSRHSQPPAPEPERNTRRRLDLDPYPISLPKPETSIQSAFTSPFPPFHSIAGSPQHSSFPPVTSGPPTHHNHRLPMVESKPPVPGYSQNWPGPGPSNGHA